MSVLAPRILELREHEQLELERDLLALDEGRALWEQHEKHVDVDFPSPRTRGRWRLRSRGYVGHLVLGEGLVLSLQPKVPLHNLFRMLELAFRFRDLRFDKRLVGLGSLAELFDHLASLLASRVMQRARRGFHRSYVDCREELGFVRGRLDLAAASHRPWRVGLPCEYDDLTLDVEENRILAWTLHRILRASPATCGSRAVVRQAWRLVGGGVELQPFRGDDCSGRFYSRLTADYEPMHALCRFFLDCTGPTHRTGERQMLPFLIGMPRLFEVFVAEWLRSQLPAHLVLETQLRHQLREAGGPAFQMDLVVRDRATRAPLAVIDTKYKNRSDDAPADIAQVAAYCVVLGCGRGFLAYPVAVTHANYQVGAVQVERSAFRLDQDLDAAGAEFLATLGLGS